MDSTILINSESETELATDASGYLSTVCEFPKETPNRIKVTVGDFNRLKVKALDLFSLLKLIIFFKADEYLNDVLVNFYLLYQFEKLSKDTQKRIHIFPSTFYQRLSSPEKGAKPVFNMFGFSKSELRHAGVREAFIEQMPL